MVLLECLPWIPIVFFNLMRAIGIGVREEPLVLELQQDEPLVLESQQEDVVNDLPDDCLIDILTRLASYDVLVCRSVCKKWYILTSSDLFIESQTKRAPTIILGDVLARYSHGGSHNYFTIADKEGKIKLNKLQLKKIGTNFSKNVARLLYSFGGLLVFYKYVYNIFIVLNIISRKEAIIRKPQDNDGKYLCGELCGLFFHPLGREYNLLFVHFADNGSYWYYVYGSTSNSWRSINTMPLHFRPPYMYDPVFVDMGLHWIVDFGGTATTRHGVMVFKIESEEICTFPLHELVGNDSCDSSMMTVFEIDKRLGFAHQITSTREINMWVLNDYRNWRWAKIRTLRFGGGIPAGPSRCNIPSEHSSENGLKIFYVCPDKLLISWKLSAPYLLDLTHSTLRRMHWRHIGSDIDGFYNFASYTCCLRIPNV